ncbi:MAG: hypothetical protein IH971_03335 [Candidatus Marinimicrobia bacterium]|nr:hypothetical protein [Candidatus Neomarinimicrobiota bacterium]
MKHRYLSLSGLVLLIACAEIHDENDLESVTFDLISLKCMPNIMAPGTLVVRTQEEYEQFLDDRFTQKLDSHWERFYPGLLETAKQQNPGLTDEEYEALVKDMMFQFLPFSMVKDCGYPDDPPIFGFPKIDFSSHTLLGIGIGGGGCAADSFGVEVFREDAQLRYICRGHAIFYGTCEKIISRYFWLLIPPMPESYSIEFDVDIERRDG